MANYFSYCVRVECAKKDVKDIVEFFENSMYGGDEFCFEKTKFGFVGEGICAWSFINELGDDACEISKKYKCAIDVFGEAIEDDFCEYACIYCGKFIMKKEGFCYNIDEFYDYEEEVIEAIEYEVNEILGTIDDDYITIDDFEDCDLCHGARIYEFYYDFASIEQCRLYKLPCNK